MMAKLQVLKPGCGYLDCGSIQKFRPPNRKRFDLVDADIEPEPESDGALYLNTITARHSKVWLKIKFPNGASMRFQAQIESLR